MRNLVAACLLTGTLGSIHAFSVFIAPLEATLGVSRAPVSLIYSLALVCLTLAMLLGHRLYHRFAPSMLAAGAAGAAALGLAVAGLGHTLPAFYLGYSLLFGAANGLGYGFALTLASRTAHRGVAMGAVTGSYALGASGFAKIFALLVAWGGVTAALSVLAAVLVFVAVAAVPLLAGSTLSDEVVSREAAAVEGQFGRLVVWMWLGYGLGVAAGLMAIGHAAGIVAASGGLMGDAVTGAMLIGLGNAAGGFASGWLADRWPVRLQLVGLPLLSAAALFALVQWSAAPLAIAALTVIGFAYGALIVAYPVAVAARFEPARFAKVYGRIFTAWGAAGLAAPWIAGVLYDASGAYAMALMLAGGAALLSALNGALTPHRAAEAALSSKV